MMIDCMVDAMAGTRDGFARFVRSTVDALTTGDATKGTPIA